MNLKDFFDDIKRNMETNRRNKWDEKEVHCPYCMEKFRLGDVKFRACESWTEDEIVGLITDDKINEKEAEDMKKFIKKEHRRFKEAWNRRGWSNDTVSIREMDNGYYVDKEALEEELEEEERKRKKINAQTEQNTVPEAGEVQNTVRAQATNEDRSKALNEVKFHILENPKKQREKGFITAAEEYHLVGDKMVKYETNLKMCPLCYALLPVDYGRYPIRFLSVLGVRASGKTVYLTQLLNKISDGAYGFGAVLSSCTQKFIEIFGPQQGVYTGNQGATTAGKVYPPMFMNVSRKGRIVGTIVLYDIAGENCVNADLLASFGPYVEKSDGVIMLISPEQLNSDQVEGESFIEFEDKLEETTQPMNQAIAALFGMLVNHNNNIQDRMPIAVTLSKSDVYQRAKRSGVLLAGDNKGEKHHIYMDLRKSTGQGFHAEDHKLVHAWVENVLDGVYGEGVNTDHTGLGTQLNNFGNKAYFACAAIGQPLCDGQAVKPEPKRVEEPLGWMYMQWGWIPQQGKYVPFMLKSIFNRLRGNK